MDAQRLGTVLKRFPNHRTAVLLALLATAASTRGSAARRPARTGRSRARPTGPAPRRRRRRRPNDGERAPVSR